VEKKRKTTVEDFSYDLGIRLVELIKRDPLYEKVNRIISKSIAKKNDSIKGDSVTSFQFKWQCVIWLTINKKISKEDSIISSIFPVNDLWAVRFKGLPAKVEIPERQNGCWVLPFVGVTGIPVLTPKLPIFINLSVVDKHDIDSIRNFVTKKINEAIDAYRNDAIGNQYAKKRGVQIPEENLALYQQRYLKSICEMKKETFKEYLKWYDIHTKEKLSFRLIAHIDKISKTNPSKASEILEKLKSKKIRWGNPVRGEDKIEKGVKLTYEAIHRKKYLKKQIEPLTEEYNCPQHKKDCPTSCNYRKDWLGKFNRLMPAS